MKLLTIVVWALLLGTDARAAVETPDVTVLTTVTAAIAVAAQSLLPMALRWLSVFMLIQFVLTNIGLLKSGADLEAMIGKLAGSLLWFGFCFYVINKGPDLMDSVGKGILNQFAGRIPTPGLIIGSTFTLCSAILAGVVAVGLVNTSLGMFLTYVLFIIFGVGMFLAIKIFMLGLELGLIIMLAPLSFSMLGLHALKDQGLAPLKSLIALVYKIILMGVLCTAFTKVIDVGQSSLIALSWLNPLDWPSMMKVVFSVVGAFPVIGYLVFKSDSIAASLAGGSSSMGTADVAGAAALGAATGAAMGAGGAALAGSAPVQSMAGVMQALREGGGASVSNASTTGTGGGTGGLAGQGGGRNSLGSPQDSASPRLGESPAGAFATGSKGQPLADPNSGPIARAADSPLGGESSGSQAQAPANGDFASTLAGKSGPGASLENSAPMAAPTGDEGAASGSGASAGIVGGGGSVTEQTLAKLADVLAAQNGPRKPTVGETLGTLGRHIEQEKAHVGVSINTLHAD